MQEISSQDFEQKVLNSKLPVIVDFYAEWCGPCQMQAPILADFAKDNQSVCQIFSANVELNQDLAAKFQVQGIPCLILFKDGQEADRRTGLQSKTKLAEFLGAA